MRRYAIGFLATFTAGLAAAQAPSPTNLGWLRGECGDGALAYFERGEDRIWLTELATGATTQAGNGTQPEFSPDSSKLAWIDGSTAKGRMRKGDTTVHSIATGVTEGGGVHWISNTEVVVVKSGRWVRVSLSGAESDVPALTALGTGGSETDVKLGSDGVWSYTNGTIWKTSDGQSGDTGGSCSPSLSPGGDSVTGLLHGHKTCLLTRVRSGGYQGQLEWVYDFTGEKGFDNHRWSSNSDDLVVCQDEKYNYMFVMKVGTTTGTRMGNTGGGDEMYGDFTVGDGTGSPWPGTAVEPSLLLSPSSLGFSAVEGGGQPAARSVSVSNAGDGTLDAVSTSVSYGAGAGWLSVTRSGSGNSQTLSNTVDITGLVAGSYQATVTVSCGNAVNSPESYSVTLGVSEVLSLDRVEVTPASTSIIEGGDAVFQARALDQSGAPFPATITWSVSGGGTISPPSSGSDVSQHSSTFSSDGSSGSFTITAAATGGVQGTAEVVVTEVAALHLKVNCGDNALTPAGWLNDEAFATGGVDFVFADTFDTSALTDPAPPGVYQTCRHRIRNVEVGYGFDFPGVPDGDYRLRLHFGDAFGPRAIDLWVEGEERISDFDIVTAAGGQYLGWISELAVTVGGGDGLQLELTDNRAAPEDVFVNGIEVIGGGSTSNLAPVVDAGFDQLVQLGDPVFLDGTVSDDGLPGGDVTLTWSEVDGPGDVSFSDAAIEDPEVSFTAAGTYTLRLSADDGALQAFDEVQITLTEQPAIQIITPNGGELLSVGALHHIEWDTVALDDVQIDYSTDDGASWINITSSCDTASPDWEHYPWTVPDEPSTMCRIRIAGYFGEAPTTSAGTFVILPAGTDGGVRPDAATAADVTGTDAGSAGDAATAIDGGASGVDVVRRNDEQDDVDLQQDGCACGGMAGGSASALGALVALGVLLGRQRRPRWWRR